MGGVDGYSSLRSRISPDSRIRNEVSSRIQRARSTFNNLRHPRCASDIRIKDQVCAPAERSVALQLRNMVVGSKRRAELR